MNPDHIPDPDTCALYISGNGKKIASATTRYILFLSDDGCFVVHQERHVNRKDPSKNTDHKIRLGFWRDMRTRLPELVVRDFVAAIDEYNDISASVIQ